MSYADEVFKRTALDIINNGVSDEGQIVRPHWEDGTPAYTVKKFGVCNTFDLQKEFPATTVRPVALKSCFDEILWIWQKQTSDVSKLNSKIWDSWKQEDGTIKKAYGYQFSKKYKFPQGEMTQVDDVLWQIKNTPMSRRMQTSIYNYEDLHDMPLYPCFWGTMWDVDIENGLLNLTVLSRSNDYLVAGMGWNPCQYALLLMMFAQVTGYKPGIMNVYINNCHIYDRHIPIVKELMKRPTYDAPIVKLNPDIKNFYDFTVNDLIVENYQKNPQVKDIPVAI